jgi:glycosyltransferase involved in cell wall biosynthesis
MPRPQVSVLTITHNQEDFVAETVTSVMTQETDFDYELVIGDDASTDGTRDLLVTLGAQYPRRIHLLFADTRLGPLHNFARTYRKCRGQYLATVDGDDYWTDAYKLQRQVDLLEARPEHAMCFHSAYIVRNDQTPSASVFRPHKIKPEYDVNDILEYNFIATCSPMYRKGLYESLPDWYFSTPVYDWPLDVLYAMRGTIGYIDEPMAAYRQHTGGIYSGHDLIAKTELAVAVLEHFRRALGSAHEPAVTASLCNQYCRLARLQCDNLRPAQARDSIKRCVREIRQGRYTHSAAIMKAALRAYAPRVHGLCRWLRARGDLLHT